MLVGSCLWAQQPKKVTDKFFPDPEGVTINTPSFEKKSGFTSYKEMMEFLKGLSEKYPSLIKIELVGKTQRENDIPLVHIHKDSPDEKLRILYTARIHGDEPAGTDAMLYFIKKLAEDPSVGTLLEKIDFYIMPMVNIDGAAKMERYTANGLDLNRDMTRIETPEAAVFYSVVRKTEPDVYADFHEYQPVRRDFASLTNSVISTPWDVMFLFSSNPNVPQVLRDAVDNLFVANATKVMDSNHLTSHTYYTSRETSQGITFNIGGSSARSTSNAMALHNTLSILVEARGINLSRTSLLRRVNTVYLLAESFARTAFDNQAKIKQYIADAIADKSDIAVKFSSKRVDNIPLPFIDMIKNNKVTFEVPAAIAAEYTVNKKRTLPTAYYILPSQKRAIDILQQTGIETKTLTEPETMNVDVFTVKTIRNGEPLGNITPADVTVDMQEKKITFPSGTVVVPADQRNFRMATVLLEPEAANGFVNYRVIETKQGEELPIYRITKNKGY